ncbi:hypothetical protein ASPVEDRAFT_78373 [Aspergillus versicolor CBS 583.65]|uniref:Cyanovirin-N domain-containing protein n=1 Tax=Aspergillus versicolor CBS 583.65 TaxID=1036611 RepID=A0A1L9P501_ASPVE|nr:uncharacterized protein ASPVEDRAFT_78373 [Aspergillus versicolor CBS 583.65]OJI96607.1 hypothetical protein ASPVEDRAFT_78373 [Aspergillus versicolor CBS 583.65]
MFSSTLFLSLIAATGTLAAPAADNIFQKRELSCQDNGGGYQPVSAAQSCVDYLNNKSGDDCAIKGENGIFCQNGDLVIAGSNISGKDSTSSSCGDVAAAAQAVIDSCTNSQQQVAGYNEARGNGDLIVSINHK